MNLLSYAILAFDTATTAATTTAASDEATFGPLFKLVIGLYLLYVGLLGKGKILENKHLKMDEKKFRLYMRLIAGAGAVFTLADGALEYFYPDTATLTVAKTVLWALGLAALVGMLVLSIAMTDRKAVAEEQKKADEEMMRKQRDKMRAAFEFDDEPEEDAEEAEVVEKEWECEKAEEAEQTEREEEIKEAVEEAKEEAAEEEKEEKAEEDKKADGE
jgi:flagellar biosynthesis GTPase FlhF